VVIVGRKKKIVSENPTLFQYEIWIHDGSYEGWYRKHNVIASTPSKAKYDYYLEIQDCWPDLSFRNFVKKVRYRKVGIFNVSCLFGNYESFERMCQHRNLPFAYQGMRIEVAGKMGTIVGSNRSMNLDVVLDGECIAGNCHPAWETKYFDRNGFVIKDNTKKSA
jgi:hypothetical protein